MIKITVRDRTFIEKWSFAHCEGREDILKILYAYSAAHAPRQCGVLNQASPQVSHNFALTDVTLRIFAVFGESFFWCVPVTCALPPAERFVPSATFEPNSVAASSFCLYSPFCCRRNVTEVLSYSENLVVSRN